MNPTRGQRFIVVTASPKRFHEIVRTQNLAHFYLVLCTRLADLEVLLGEHGPCYVIATKTHITCGHGLEELVVNFDPEIEIGRKFQKKLIGAFSFSPPAVPRVRLRTSP